MDTAFSLTRPWESDESVHAGLRRVCAGEGSRRASNGGLSDRSPEAMLARARIRKPLHAPAEAFKSSVYSVQPFDRLNFL